MTSILLSVRPAFAHALLAGTKTVEVRRRFPDVATPATIYVYSSTPDRAVLGTIELEGIDRPLASSVWDLYRHEIQIHRQPLEEYLENVNDAAILRVRSPIRWPKAVPLALLRSEIGLEPPQSFRYVDSAREELLRLCADGVTSTTLSALTAAG